MSENSTNHEDLGKLHNSFRYSFHSTPNLVGGQVTLDAKIFDSGNYQTPPVAPPRKKRSTLKKGSTLPTNFGDSDDQSGVRNGFKDVFNGGTSRSLNYDDIEYIDKNENTIKTRATVEQTDDKLNERKLKVGNKKTDKFFGESLSDHLSDEPVSPIEEKANPLSTSPLPKDEADRTSSDKKFFFLMNMLAQDFEEAEKYKDKAPIEEPLFVARKKEIKRHICDDDDHMHSHRFHDNEHDQESRDHVAAPPKPDRDFSKYQTSSGEDSGRIEDALQRTAADKVDESQMRPQIKKAFQRENLPTPPETPKRKSGVSLIPGSPGTPTITIESIDFDTPSDSHEKNVYRKQVSRSSSSDSFKTPEVERKSFDRNAMTAFQTKEIVDHLKHKAFGLHEFHPEDSEHTHNDGSSLSAPTSKLTTRKISVTRKKSSDSLPSSDDESLSSSNELFPPGTPQKKISLIEDPLMKIIESHLGSDQFDLEQERSLTKSPVNKKRNYEKLLIGTSVNDIIEEIYSKNSE